MDINHYHIFKDEDKYFIFDTYYMILVEVSKEQLYVFKNYQKDDIILSNELGVEIDTIQDSRDLIELSKEKGLFISEIMDEDHEITDDIGFISITPVHKCNLRCSYCFAECGENYTYEKKYLDTDKLNAALDMLYSKIFKNAHKIRIDFVGGGEPFLNINIIESVLDITNRLDKSKNKNTSIWICTNGTIMSERILKCIDNPKVNLGISLDGDREQHNKIRRDRYNKGTYDTIIKNLEYIKNNSKHGNLRNIWALSVVNSKTESLVNILKNHKKLGFDNVQMKLVRLKKDHILSINEDNINHVIGLYDDLVEYLIRELENDRYDYLKMILNNNDYLGKIINKLVMQRRVYRRCMAGKIKVSLTANGDIYPCDPMVGNNEFKLFNIADNIEKIPCSEIGELTTDIRKNCNKCWAKYICGGDCPHNAYLVNGNIFTPDPCFCKIQKHLIYLSLKILYTISLNEKIAKELTEYIRIRERLSL